MTMPSSPLRPLPPSGIDVWIFDLDNTLYPATSNLFDQVSQRMSSFIAERFGMSFDEARALQKRLFREHGTTLRGLMVEHDIDPVPFLDYVHAIDVTPIAPAPELALALNRLPGRKIIYTNGSIRHAANVTDRLGITDRFDAVFGIIEAGYIPKPDPRPYQMLIEQQGIDPRRACMVEDIARNLVPAHALGMTTVWLKSDIEWAQADREGVGTGSHIDHVVEDLVSWLSDLTKGTG
jgi:putative hydrolase of the HAD superfamily